MECCALAGNKSTGLIVHNSAEYHIERLCQADEVMEAVVRVVTLTGTRLKSNVRGLPVFLLVFIGACVRTPTSSYDTGAGFDAGTGSAVWLTNVQYGWPELQGTLCACNGCS